MNLTQINFYLHCFLLQVTTCFGEMITVESSKQLSSVKSTTYAIDFKFEHLIKLNTTPITWQLILCYIQVCLSCLLGILSHLQWLSCPSNWSCKCCFTDFFSFASIGLFFYQNRVIEIKMAPYSHPQILNPTLLSLNFFNLIFIYCSVDCIIRQHEHF